jgi:hypothetical protein
MAVTPSPADSRAACGCRGSCPPATACPDSAHAFQLKSGRLAAARKPGDRLAREGGPRGLAAVAEAIGQQEVQDLVRPVTGRGKYVKPSRCTRARSARPSARVSGRSVIKRSRVGMTSLVVEDDSAGEPAHTAYGTAKIGRPDFTPPYESNDAQAPHEHAPRDGAADPHVTSIVTCSTVWGRASLAVTCGAESTVDRWAVRRVSVRMRWSSD